MANAACCNNELFRAIRVLTFAAEEVPKPIVVEPRDVILKVTGSTICGSDLHLLHGNESMDITI